MPTQASQLTLGRLVVSLAHGQATLLRYLLAHGGAEQAVRWSEEASARVTLDTAVPEEPPVSSLPTTLFALFSESLMPRDADDGMPLFFASLDQAYLQAQLPGELEGALAGFPLLRAVLESFPEPLSPAATALSMHHWNQAVAQVRRFGELWVDALPLPTRSSLGETALEKALQIHWAQWEQQLRQAHTPTLSPARQASSKVPTRARRVWVTGAAGLIGSRLIEALRFHHPDVMIVGVDALAHFDARPEHQGPLLPHAYLSREAALKADVWNSNERPDLVFHLGACSDTTQTDWDYLRRVNLEYSQQLWNHCTAHEIPLVYASSAATYGSGPSDDAPNLLPGLTPLNLYGKSKQLFDLWVHEQVQHHRAPPRWYGFKFFNVYGFGEAHKGRMASVVTHAYRQIRETGQVRLFASDRPEIADGDQKRDFICVEDVCRVLLWAGWEASASTSGLYNLGTGQARSFFDLARAVFVALGRPVQVTFVPMPTDLVGRYQYWTQAEMGRLRTAGWSAPFTRLEEGVRQAVARMRALPLE